jgi:hypothetical protein
MGDIALFRLFAFSFTVRWRVSGNYLVSGLCLYRDCKILSLLKIGRSFVSWNLV